MLDLTALTQEVTDQETVEAGAVAAIEGLLAAVEAAKADPAAIQALVDRGRASLTALSAAIATVPPAAPAPTA